VSAGPDLEQGVYRIYFLLTKTQLARCNASAAWTEKPQFLKGKFKRPRCPAENPVIGVN
jgi:hypothetical protein